MTAMTEQDARVYTGDSDVDAIGLRLYTIR